MNLLPSMLLYLAIGCGEWYLALRRTLACARGEKTVLVCIVFIENLLGLWVLSSFIRSNNWLVAVVYSAGASAGALLVAMNSPEKAAKTTLPRTCRSRSRRRKKSPLQLLVVRIREYTARIPARLAHFSLHRRIGQVEHPG
jgi:hypothetical protein